MVILNKMYH